MIDWSTRPAVERSADTLSGAWRFKNTRVPVKALFENLESGATVDQFLEWFPGVKREDALAVLAFAERVSQPRDARRKVTTDCADRFAADDGRHYNFDRNE